MEPNFGQILGVSVTKERMWNFLWGTICWSLALILGILQLLHPAQLGNPFTATLSSITIQKTSKAATKKISLIHHLSLLIFWLAWNGETMVSESLCRCSLCRYTLHSAKWADTFRLFLAKLFRGVGFLLVVDNWSPVPVHFQSFVKKNDGLSAVWCSESTRLLEFLSTFISHSYKWVNEHNFLFQ